MNLPEKKLVYALGGDALTSPEHTETSFWAAIGGGADGIVAGVRLSSRSLRSPFFNNVPELNILLTNY